MRTHIVMQKETRAATALAAVLSVGALGAHANAVLDWNEIMVSTVGTQNPFAQGRFAAITQLAVFEAVNAIEGDYVPYLGTVEAPRGASAEAAAVAAAHAVLASYFPDVAPALDAARKSSLAAILDGEAKEAGIAVGEAAAAAMIAARVADGSAPPQFHQPSSAEPGEWQLTAACPPAGGVLLHWGDVAPFGIESGDQFRSPPPPALRRPEYARDLNEVKRVGDAASAHRSQDRADVAQFYNAVLAVGVWNDVARQLAVARGTTLSEDARAFALLNMAIHDALVSVMETKYHYRFWRPETAIPRAGEDGNPKTAPNDAFTPFVPTPCFPSYPSAHASASYAARAVVEQLYGQGGPQLITLSSPAVPQVFLEYRRLRQITDDIDDARVYGGIHFRFDQEAGAEQGIRIGRYVMRHNLRSIHAPKERFACDDEPYWVCVARALRQWKHLR